MCGYTQQQETEAPTPKKKSKIQTITLTVDSKNTAMEPSLLTRLHEAENEMISQDRQESDRLVAKNSLEEYVIEMRRKCGEELERFVESEAREAFVRKLDGVEDWLYEDGEDELKSVYVAKLIELETIGSPIVERHRQFELRPKAFENLEAVIQRANAFVNRRHVEGDKEVEHITAEEFDKVATAASTVADWNRKTLEEQARKSLVETPVVSAFTIDAERQKLEKIVDGVMQKPKPKPKKTDESKAKKKKGEEEEKKDEEKENGGKENSNEEAKQDAEKDEKKGEELIKDCKMETETSTDGGMKDQTNDMDLD